MEFKQKKTNERVSVNFRSDPSFADTVIQLPASTELLKRAPGVRRGLRLLRRRCCREKSLMICSNEGTTPHAVTTNNSSALLRGKAELAIFCFQNGDAKFATILPDSSEGPCRAALPPTAAIP